MEVEFVDFIDDLTASGVLVAEGWDEHGTRFDEQLASHCRLLLRKPNGQIVHPEDGLIGAPYIRDNRHLQRVHKMCRMHLAEVKAMYNRMATNPQDYPSPPPPDASTLPDASPQPSPSPSPELLPSPAPRRGAHGHHGSHHGGNHDGNHGGNHDGNHDSNHGGNSEHRAKDILDVPWDVPSPPLTRAAREAAAARKRSYTETFSAGTMPRPDH